MVPSKAVDSHSCPRSGVMVTSTQPVLKPCCDAPPDGTAEGRSGARGHPGPVSTQLAETGSSTAPAFCTSCLALASDKS